jgi:hypothetical protein
MMILKESRIIMVKICNKRFKKFIKNKKLKWLNSGRFLWPVKNGIRSKCSQFCSPQCLKIIKKDRSFKQFKAFNLSSLNPSMKWSIGMNQAGKCQNHLRNHKSWFSIFLSITVFNQSPTLKIKLYLRELRKHNESKAAKLI